MHSNKRPYPEGVAWDEAWRQRRRADQMEATLRNITNLCHNFEKMGSFDDPETNSDFVFMLRGIANTELTHEEQR